MKTTIMTTFLESAINILLAIILPAGAYLLLIGLLMLTDTLLKLYSLKQTKEKMDWMKLFKGLQQKMLVYTPIILCIYWMDTLLMNDIVKQFVDVDLLTTKLGSLVLASTEITSINKNFKAITGKSLLDRVKNVLHVAKDVKKGLDSITKDDKEAKEIDQI